MHSPSHTEGPLPNKEQMMAFSLKFDTDNDAFVEGGTEEVVRLLDVVRKHVRNGNTSGPLHDANGNSVGSWSLELPEPEVEGPVLGTCSICDLPFATLRYPQGDERLVHVDEDMEIVDSEHYPEP